MTSETAFPTAQPRAQKSWALTRWRRPIARLAQALAWISMFVIATLSLVPGELRPHTVLPGPAEHSLAYCAAGLLLGVGYGSHRQRFVGWLIFTLASGLFEILQNFSPGRTPSLFDAAASASGVTLGVLFGALLSHRLLDGRDADTNA
jgi:VanZ family protein